MQVSGVGHFLFIMYILDLMPLSIINLLCKYANDATLLSPKHTNIALEDEYVHIRSRGAENRLILNVGKN